MTAADIVKGNVVRMVSEDGTASPFADSVIVDIYDVDSKGARKYDGKPSRFERMVRLARPYIYVSGAGTCCPSVLTGFEDYAVPITAFTRAKSCFRIVVQSTGTPSNMVSR